MSFMLRPETTTRSNPTFIRNTSYKSINENLRKKLKLCMNANCMNSDLIESSKTDIIANFYWNGKKQNEISVNDMKLASKAIQHYFG